MLCLEISYLRFLSVNTYPAKKKILIALADEVTIEKLKNYFASSHYELLFAKTNNAILSVFKSEQPNLLIIDLILSQTPDYTICNLIRTISSVPIILLSVFDNVISCIKGLELGADDYLIKPFSLKELEARITVLLRFPAQEVGQLASSASVLKIGELTIDLLKNKIIKNGISIALTPIEFTLFTFLVENAGRSLSRIKILENVWGYTPVRDVDTRVVDVYIFRLRVKIEKTPKKPDYILTVQGKGYMFQSFLLK